MRSLLLFAIVTLLPLIAYGSGSAERTIRPNYTITIDADNTRLMKVDAELIADGDLFQMSEYGAEQFPERWARFIRSLKAFDNKNKPLAVEDLGNARWRIAAKPGELVKLRYEVLLNHDKHTWSAGIDSVSFVRDWGVFAAGRTYLITNREGSGEIGISFDLPKGWHVTTPWRADKRGTNSFVARDLVDLSASLIFAGTHKEFTVSRNGFELRFALGGELATDDVKFRSLANGVMDYYIGLMGSIPKPPPSNPFSRSVVILNPGEQTDGEVIGNNICIIVGANSDPTAELFAKFIFAHEFFHLWNGKSLVPAGTENEWFKEGFTNIYAMKALNHIGAISERELFGTLDGLFYKRYSTDPLYGKASIRDVAKGDEKHKHWGLIYGGGMFTGLCVDTEIRRSTGNTKSLNDVMRSLFSKYSDSDRTYSTEDLRSAMEAASGTELSTLFTDHIYGPSPVPIDKCLSGIGLNAVIVKGQLKVSRKPDATAIENRMIDGLLGK